MKKTVLTKLTIFIALLGSMFLSAQDSEWKFNYKIAKTSKELSKIMDNPEANIVRSVDDFKRYVQSNTKLAKVFKKEGLFKAVASTMKFNKRGLKTFSYAPLKEAFPKRFRDILSEITSGFGFDMGTLGIDYEGYECSGPGTCSKSQGSICIGDNC